MFIRIFLFNLILLLIVSIEAYGQTRKYSNDFLSIGIGGRGLSMSGATTATTTGINSSYWNPAGLSKMPLEKSLSAMHSEYFAGIAKYDFLAYASKVGKKSALAFSLIRFGVDNIPNTSQLIDAEGQINYDKVTAFSAADYAFNISFGHKTSIPGLYFGLNSKIIRRVAGDFAKSWGFGFDGGIQYQFKKFQFGLMFRDVTTTFNSWSYSFSDEMIEVFTLTGNAIPTSSSEITLPSINLGVAYDFILHENFNLLIEADAKMTTDGQRNVLISANPVSIDPALGFEFSYKKLIFLRAGLGNFQKETSIVGIQSTSFQPNMGIGIVIKDRFVIDYALTDIGNQSIALYSNIFSLKFNFNRKITRESYENK